MKQFSEKARQNACRQFKSGLDLIAEFFEDFATEMIGEGYFFGSRKSFFSQVRLREYVVDVVNDAPLSSLHREVMLPMLTA